MENKKIPLSCLKEHYRHDFILHRYNSMVKEKNSLKLAIEEKRYSSEFEQGLLNGKYYSIDSAIETLINIFPWLPLDTEYIKETYYEMKKRIEAYENTKVPENYKIDIVEERILQESINLYRSVASHIEQYMIENHGIKLS